MGHEPEALGEYWRNGCKGTCQSSEHRKVLRLLAFQHTEIIAKDKGNQEKYSPREKGKSAVFVKDPEATLQVYFHLHFWKHTFMKTVHFHIIFQSSFKNNGKVCLRIAEIAFYLQKFVERRFSF